MYVTRDLLYRAGNDDRDPSEKLMGAAVAVGTSTALGAMVGYRHEKGVAEDKLVPTLGPIPLDLGLGLAGLGLSLAGVFGEYDWVAEEAGKGALCFFGASAGQAIGKKIAEKYGSSSTSAGALMGGEYRDGHGRFMSGGTPTPNSFAGLGTQASFARR